MAMGDKGKVLVLGDDNRSCLAIVRSLGRQQISVLLGTQTADSMVSRSRYVARAIRLPSTETRVDSWLAELRALLGRESVDLVIPCSDSALVPLVRHRAEFTSLARLAIPDDLGFEYSYRKDKTFSLASQLGVPIPTTVLVESPDDLAEVQSNQELQFPLIVKPVSSKVWKNGRRLELKVRSVRDWPTFNQVVRELLDKAPVLIQNYFSGVGVGQEFLSHDGVIISAFQHERVHEPLSGGGSSYRKSVPLDESMLTFSQKMLAHLHWTGVAMVEYKQDPTTGEFVLMEINGRFWGSLPLAVAAGVDFPYQLYDLLVKGRQPTQDSYRVGLYCRNPMKDLGWFKERLAASGPSLPAKAIGEGLKNVLRGRERLDTITLDDPIPGIVEIWHESGILAKKSVGRIEKMMLAMLASNALWRQRQRARFRESLNGGASVLFICRGNICRSPFAEAYAKLRFKSLGLNGIEWTSAGTYPVERRRSPEAARLASREFAVMLDDHRSRSLDPQLIKRAGAVVCMDFRDYNELRQVFPEAKEKFFFLRSFDATGKGFQIADPWGKPVEEFRRCYRQISSSIDGLIQVLVGK